MSFPQQCATCMYRPGGVKARILAIVSKRNAASALSACVFWLSRRSLSGPGLNFILEFSGTWCPAHRSRWIGNRSRVIRQPYLVKQTIICVQVVPGIAQRSSFLCCCCCCAHSINHAVFGSLFLLLAWLHQLRNLKAWGQAFTAPCWYRNRCTCRFRGRLMLGPVSAEFHPPTLCPAKSAT